MRNLNRVTFIGHLTADPDLHQSKDGKMVAHFSLAINRKFKNAQSEIKEAVDFHRIVLFSGLADVASKHLFKGSAVYVEGRLINNNYENEKGVKQYKTEIIADNLNILTWKKESESELQSA